MVDSTNPHEKKVLNCISYSFFITAYGTVIMFSLSMIYERNDMKVNIGLKDTTQKQVAALLNQLLADEFVLYVKTLNFHWNVVGSDFFALHLFFQKQYEALLDIADEVAERVRVFNIPSFGSCAEFIEHATVSESIGKKVSAPDMLAQLCTDHEIIIQSLRKSVDKSATIGDEGTSNFLTELMEKHEKMAWMLRSFNVK
jgi:starvation-inducible DNA-binding protein